MASERCQCGKKIKTMAFKGTPYCSIKCEKAYGPPEVRSTIDRVAFERAANTVLDLGSTTHSKLFARGVNFAINELRARLT